MICVFYLNLENSRPNMVCVGIRIRRTPIPARQEGPISSHSRPTTAAAWRGPTHRKCRNMVTWREKQNHHNLTRNMWCSSSKKTCLQTVPQKPQWGQIKLKSLQELRFTCRFWPGQGVTGLMSDRNTRQRLLNESKASKLLSSIVHLVVINSKSTLK